MSTQVLEEPATSTDEDVSLDRLSRDSVSQNGDSGSSHLAEEKNMALLRQSSTLPVHVLEEGDSLPVRAEEGIYLGADEEDYHAHEGLSRSVLATAARESPKHAYHKWKKSSTDEDTGAMNLGTALHKAVLETEAFLDSYEVAPETCEATKNSGDPCTYSAKNRYEGSWYCGTHAPNGEEPDEVETITMETAEKIIGMHEALRGNPDTYPLLFGLDGISELTIVFDDPETGITCKARIDRVVFLPDGKVTLVDLKSTRSAHPDDFRRSISKFGYWLQPSFYTLAFQEATTLPVREFLFGCVEKEAPYATETYRLAEQDHAGATARMKELLSKMNDGRVEGSYPGYNDGITPIGMKSYEKDRLGIQSQTL